MKQFEFDSALALAEVPIEDRARLAALIPDPRLADAYVNRYVDGIEDFDLLDIAMDERENVLLAGPTGSSKTSVFRAYAASRRLPFTVVDCNGAMDPGVIIGRTTIAPDGSVKFVDGDMTLIVRYFGVVLVDEANLAHQRITAAWHQLLAVTRRMSIPEAGETVIAGRGRIEAWEEDDETGIPQPIYTFPTPQPVLFCSAYNPRYQGTVRLNEAFANRFAVPLDWDYDRAVEEALTSSTALLDMATHIRSLAEIRTPVSTNMLMEFERHALRMGQQLAERLFLGHFAAEERGPVHRALEANRANIANELELV